MVYNVYHEYIEPDGGNRTTGRFPSQRASCKFRVRLGVARGVNFCIKYVPNNIYKNGSYRGTRNIS